VNKAQRQPYLDLMPEIVHAHYIGIVESSTLCALCKYASCYWEEYDHKTYFECNHPIERVSMSHEYGRPLPNLDGDCWGFRPISKDIDQCRRYLETGLWHWQHAMATQATEEGRDAD
jgi:hypothetical protein